MHYSAEHKAAGCLFLFSFCPSLLDNSANSYLFRTARLRNLMAAGTSTTLPGNAPCADRRLVSEKGSRKCPEEAKGQPNRAREPSRGGCAVPWCSMAAAGCCGRCLSARLWCSARKNNGGVLSERSIGFFCSRLPEAKAGEPRKRKAIFRPEGVFFCLYDRNEQAQ